MINLEAWLGLHWFISDRLSLGINLKVLGKLRREIRPPGLKGSTENTHHGNNWFKNPITSS